MSHLPEIWSGIQDRLKRGFKPFTGAAAKHGIG